MICRLRTNSPENPDGLKTEVLCREQGNDGAVSGPPGILFIQIAFHETGHFEEMFHKPGFQCFVPMHGNRYDHIEILLAVNVMAALDSEQSPSVALQNLCQLITVHGRV